MPTSELPLKFAGAIVPSISYMSSFFVLLNAAVARMVVEHSSCDSARW